MKTYISVLLLGAVISAADGKDKWKIHKDFVLYESIVAGTKVKVVISEQAFDPSKHRIAEKENIGTNEKPEYGPTVDYKPVVGNSIETQGQVPPAGSPQLKSIVVHFGEVMVEVPSHLLNNVFFARLSAPGVFSLEYADSIVSISSDAKCVQISLSAGEQEGRHSPVFFAVDKNGRATEEMPLRNQPRN